MDRITLPNGITIESTTSEKTNTLSEEAMNILNTFSAESILEAFVACESNGVYGTEEEASVSTESSFVLPDGRVVNVV